ncbi:MAG: TonB-dependent receptor, partial [Ekhidna sp.]|nr:TonB-dependent receptor [Ekhidna sp.]
MIRPGLNYRWRNLKATYQFSYLGTQFSDATNSEFNPNALTGVIPSYYVMDLSFEYIKDWYKCSFGINNFTNQTYFTRRAESYPGPGIIPATPRSFYFSMGLKI